MDNKNSSNFSNLDPASQASAPAHQDSNPSDYWAKRNAAAMAANGVTAEDIAASAAAHALKADRYAHAVEVLREVTADEAPQAADFAATAKLLNANRFAPPSGKRWTATQVQQAFRAYLAVAR